MKNVKLYAKAFFRLLVRLKPLDGPSAIVHIDPALGFCALREDDILKQLNISLDIGHVKNANKNPVAEKAILELEDELLRQEPGPDQVTPMALAIATARLNSRLRTIGLSSRELWKQRSQYTHNQLPISNRNIIRSQSDTRNVTTS